MTKKLRGNLEGLVVFITVAEAGSFTATAERLGMTKAGVSLQISRLESRLGVSLFSRTTRQVKLTPAGEKLYRESAEALQTLNDALAGAGAEETTLSGTIRLTAPVDHAVQSVAPAIAAFAELHPAIQFDIRTSDQTLDLVAEGIDLAIRLGHLRDSSLRAIKLGDFEQQVIAAPDYLRRYGTPKRPEDLAHHQWIALTVLRSPLTWTFSRAGEQRVVRVKTRIRVDSSSASRSLLLQGAGISVLDQYSIAEAVRAGQLVRVLKNWTLPQGGVYAVMPPGRHVPANVRAFVEFYRQYLLQRSGRTQTPSSRRNSTP